MRSHERFVAVDGHQVWVRRVGETTHPERLPLVLLHGGPGVPSDDLEPLERLAEGGAR